MIIQKKIAVFEMVLIISMSLTFSYFLDESLGSMPIQPIQKESRLAEILPALGKMIFNENGIVSALEASDAEKGVYTCLKTKKGESCQEFPASQCDSQCAGVCIPASRENAAGCIPGTCYDPVEGGCQAGSPQNTCSAKGGQWFGDKFENIAQCRKGCCIIGGQSSFDTEQQCTRKSELLGSAKIFRTDIKNDVACIALGQQQEEGACVLAHDFERNCKFTTRQACGQLRGEFFSQLLCSNPSLNTTCKPQQITSCSKGIFSTPKVYWFDSCGNRENVYDYLHRNELKQSGKVVPLDSTCAVSSGSNPVANAKYCGNCDVLLGSSCGRTTGSGQVSTGDVVCKELSCVDKSGKKRANGESWCEYQGSVGVDSVKNRGMDTPGSSHFRVSCINGELTAPQSCGEYRTGICEEQQTKIPGGSISSASCRRNLAPLCQSYNLKGEMDKCVQNPDCFIKSVSVGKNFKFDLCAPKYKPGFDLAAREEGAAAACTIANQKCQAIFIKKLSGWKCEANCECLESSFAEQMNDLCMSMGDCGGQVNYLGAYTGNYKASSKGKAIKSGQSYTLDLTKYSKTIPGKFVQAADPQQIFDVIGIPAGLGIAADPKDPAAAFAMAGMVSGVFGIGILAAAKTGLGLSALSAVNLGTQGTVSSVGASLGPGLTAAGGALAGAAIGFAAVSMLLQYTGVGRGLPVALTYHLMAVGTAAGAIIGLNFALSSTGSTALGAGSAGFSASGLAFAAAVAWVAIIVVIVVIVIFKLLGIGKIKKVDAIFQCNAWQAPKAGKECGKCGSDGYTCTRYACESLGQTCQIINEGSAPECIDIAPDDATPPTITFRNELLGGNFSVENYDQGVKVKRAGSESTCIQDSYELMNLGIALNEPGKCRVSNSTGVPYEQMESEFGSSMYVKNHTVPFVIPSLESLGLEGFDPRARYDYSLALKCEDKSGNAGDKDFVVNFCIKQGPDFTPPLIVDRTPFLEQARFDASAINATIYTNEPADCKWDLLDTDYSSMRNELTCENEFEQRTLGGWACNATLPLESQENQFFMRCLDQPWRNESEQSQRNAASQSYVYHMKKTSEALKIDALTPDGQTIKSGTEPTSVTIAVKTSGGVDGKSRCYYSWNNGSFVEFAQGIGTQTHQQIFQSLTSGTYTLPVKCEDIAGNAAQRSASFTLQLDTSPPVVTRIYQSGNQLKLITNEEALCVYQTTLPKPGEESCAFEFKNGTSMGAQGREHTLAFNSGATYFVKCKDQFERGPGTSCSMIVKGANYA